jgi:polysaccharide biosynthesis protein PslG
VVVAILGIGSAMCAASPLAAAPKPDRAKTERLSAGLFGTQPLERPSRDEDQRMAAGGLQHVRMVFSADAPAGRGDWTELDTLVGDAASAGLTVDPVLFGVPRWINADPASVPLQSEGQESYWGRFVRNTARRYGPGGQFWALHPELPARPITWWEVWNEPNINEFTGRRTPLKARDYARLLRITRAALKEASPANRIVVGGLYRRPKRGHGIRMTRYLQQLYRVRGGRRLFDAVAIHPYSALPKQILRVTQSARRVMNANGDRRKPLWITEVGWSTGGNFWAQSLYHATPEQQATRLQRTALLLLAHRRRLRLQRVDWFSWRDYAGSDNFWDKYMGLFTADGHPKPAWGALTQVTGGFAGGQIANVGHNGPISPGPGPPPGGGGGKPPPRQCLLPGILC